MYGHVKNKTLKFLHNFCATFFFIHFTCSYVLTEMIFIVVTFTLGHHDVVLCFEHLNVPLLSVCVCVWSIRMQSLASREAECSFGLRLSLTDTTMLLYLNVWYPTKNCRSPRVHCALWSRSGSLRNCHQISQSCPLFTALHGMQMRSCDENLSVRLSVRQTRAF